MSKRIDLLRLDYMFSVIVPMLLAIYFNDLSIMDHLDILVGFGFLAITGNTLNDAIDARDPDDHETHERIEGYHWKEIAAIGIIAFIFGIMMFARTVQEHPINGVYLAASIIMVIVYCVKKDVIIFNQILLGISHVFFPYLMIKTDANSSPLLSQMEWIIMLCFFSYAFSGQIVHEVIDKDSISRLSLRGQQITVIVSSIITIIFGAIVLIILEDIYFLPLAFIPFGSIYTFRKPTESTKGVKDVGIIMGNIIMIYFLVLIII